MTAAKLPKFGRPPVSEVVCGIYCQNLAGLQVAHVGRLWDSLRERYPRTDTLRPLPPVLSSGSLPEIEGLALDLDQFPRVWFISDDGTSVVQLQRDRLILNWRRQSPDAAYPSYDRIIADLNALHSVLVEFLREENLGRLDVVGVELAYVNTCVFGRELDGPAQVGRVLPLLAWRPTGRSAGHRLTGIGWNAQLDLPEGQGNLYIAVNTTHRQSDGLGALRFDLLARRFSAEMETEGMWSWFDMAHDAIVGTFAEITDETVQEEFWERQP